MFLVKKVFFPLLRIFARMFVQGKGIMARLAFLCVVVPFVLFSCGDKVPSRSVGVVEIPDSVRGAMGRATFAALHFWDGMQDGDTLFCNDMEVSDSLFQKYVFLVSKLPDEAIRGALMHCTSLLKQNDKALSAFDDSRERILLKGGKDAALYDKLSRAFLKVLLKGNIGEEYQKERWRDELKLLSQNRINGYANNFVFYGVSNNSQSLSTFFEGRGGVLFFFDPDCENCDNALAVMESQRNNLLKGVKVLAVYAGGDSGVWRFFCKTKHPEWITWAWDKGLIFKNSNYLLRRMPSFYVIDAKGKVQLYDGTIEDLLTYMAKAKQ